MYCTYHVHTQYIKYLYIYCHRLFNIIFSYRVVFYLIKINLYVLSFSLHYEYISKMFVLFGVLPKFLVLI